MRISYKKAGLERLLISLNVMAGAVVMATFVALFGFYHPLADPGLLYGVQVGLLCFFVGEKILRAVNAVSLWEYWRANWFEIPLLVIPLLVALGAEAEGRWRFPMGVYLVLQVVSKACRSIVHLLALGKNPMRVFVASFLLLVVAGAGALCLPRATVSHDNITVVDALFTSTSAACVTGLTVKNTGQDFTVMGQIVILLLIQLGGLGIVLFGAVFALLFGQAFSIRESVAMQDLLSASTLDRITRLIAFVFASTMAIEAIGAVVLVGMWPKDPNWSGSGPQAWFFSIFHSVSAFCNAGLSLFKDNLVAYRRSWQVYAVICPLIILGGLGFGVLYNLWDVAVHRIRRTAKRIFSPNCRFTLAPVRSLALQTKIAISVSAILIILGTLGILVLERYTVTVGLGAARSLPDAFFQSVTARTAGFNTIAIGAMTESSKVVLILLMFIGGSPGGTAGGIKTVTLAVMVMAVMSTLHQRGEVQMFRRSIRGEFVSRALAVILIYASVLFLGVLAFTLSERDRGLPFLDLMFEATSALGTVGLSTGITPQLSSSGKVILILLMLIGRLGPLSLAAALTFDTRRARYTYPQEALMVG